MQTDSGCVAQSFCILHFAFCITRVAADAQIGRQIAEIAIEQEGRPVTDPVDHRPHRNPRRPPLRCARGARDDRAPDEPQPVRRRAGVSRGRGRRRARAVCPDAASPGRSHGVPRHARPVRRTRSARRRRSLRQRHRGRPAPPRSSRRCEWNTGGAATRMRASARGSSRHTIRIARRSIFEIEAGRALTIADSALHAARRRRPGHRRRSCPTSSPAQPYDDDAIERELRRWEDRMRARGYYEARASHGMLKSPTTAPIVSREPDARPARDR